MNKFRHNPDLIRWLCDQIDSAHIHNLAKANPTACEHLFKGFKVSAKNAAKSLVKKRLASMLEKSGDMFIYFLESDEMPWAKWKYIGQILNPEFFLKNWRPLIESRHAPGFALAFRFSPDEKLQTLGHRLLQLPSVFSKKSATLPVTPIVTELLDALQPKQLSTADVTEEKTDRKAEKNQERLQKRIDQLKQQNESRKKKIKQLETDCRQTVSELKNENRKLSVTHKAAVKENSRLASEIEERAASRFNAFKKELLGTETTIDTKTAQGAAKDTNKLLKQTENILEEHKHLNEKYNTLSDIRQEIQHLKQALGNIDNCIDESLIVRPNLPRLRNHIQQQINSLNALPGVSDPDTMPEFASMLLEEIKQAGCNREGENKLKEAEHLLALQTTHSLLGNYWRNYLQEQLTKKKKRVTTIRKEKLFLHHEPEPISTNLAPSEIWNLKAELKNKTIKPHIIVDAYNVILTVPELHQLIEQFNLAETQKELQSLAARKASFFIECELVFDGDFPLTSIEDTGRLRIVYAAKKQSDQNADNYIFDRACFLESQSSDKLWLVTDDYGLRSRVAGLCDVYISPADYYNFLIG